MPAAITALSLEEETQMMADSFKERCEVIYQLLDALPGVTVPKPEGAFYALCDITGTGMSDIEFANRALEEAQVQLDPWFANGRRRRFRTNLLCNFDGEHRRRCQAFE